jgi:hypothetical protein
MRLSKYLKSQIKLRGMTYGELADALKKFAQDESDTSIANKLSRSAFSAEFFVACLLALGVQRPDLSYFDSEYR